MAGGGTLPLNSASRAKRDCETRGRGVLPGVYRSGANPRLPKALAELRVGESRMGCRRGEIAGIPAGKAASKLGRIETHIQNISQ